MKVLLVTSFEDYFLEQDTLPALARRGVEVAARFPAKKVDAYDLSKYKAEGVSLILHMNEVGGHDASEKLTTRAKLADLPIKALSRKKASWNFLPPLPSSEADPPSLPRGAGEDAIDNIHERLDEILGYNSDGVRMHSDPLSLLAAEVTEETARVAEFFIETNFDRKQARLRDVVQLIIAHGLVEYQRVLNAVIEGRKNGVFPRLARLKPEQLPKLVKSMLAHELNALKNEKTEGKVRSIHMFREDEAAIKSLGIDTGAGIRTVDAVAGLKQFENDKEITMQAEKPLRLATTIAPPSPEEIRRALITWGRLVFALKQSPHAEQFVRFLGVAKTAGLSLDEVVEALGDE